MIETGKREARSHMVVVVGVDLSDVSEHVLARARDLVRSIDDAELHVVHVVEPQPLRHLVFESLRPAQTGARSDPELALRELQGFCESSLPGSRERVVLHTPVGRPADELARIALKTAADIIVVEVHDHPPRVFHHAVVARLARIAPCSVLAIRDPGRKGPKWASSESGLAMTP
jgi:nucleotide-binding universal stress UspA family protein